MIFKFFLKLYNVLFHSTYHDLQSSMTSKEKKPYYHHSEKRRVNIVSSHKGEQNHPHKLNALRFIFSILGESDHYKQTGWYNGM